MVKIIKQLQDSKFRFVPIQEGTKKPIGLCWQTTNNYRYYEGDFLNGSAYGVVCGFGNLFVLDFDNKELQEKLLKELPKTLTIKTGGKGLFHLYFISNIPPKTFRVKGKDNKTLCDVQGIGTQVIGSGSKHNETGKLYEVVVDNPITEIEFSKIIDLFKDYEVKEFGGDSSIIPDKIIKCKFHKDNNPSMALYKETGTFYCFGCQAYGFQEVLDSKGKPKKNQTKKGIQYYFEKSDIRRYKQLMGEEIEEEKQDSKIDDDILEVLKDKDLFNKITITEFNKQIVGEIEARQTIFLCCCGKNVINNQIASYNLMVNSESGSGKDFTTTRVLKIFPKDYIVKRTRISEKVLNYWHNSKFEPNWSWNGKVFYLEDISNEVLNADVFKVMCSSESSVTILINQQPTDIIIKGKPVLLITTASANPKKEMTRRFTICGLDESKDQTKAILQRQAEYEEKGISIEYDEKIKKALYYLKRVKVRIPFAKQLIEIFPTENLIIRTHFQRFLDYIKASTSLHQFQREQDKEGYLIAEPQDYDIARIGLIHTTSNKFMIPLTQIEKKILDIFDKLPEFKGGKKDLKTYTDEKEKEEALAWYSCSDLEVKITFVSDKWLRKILDKLTNLGFLEKKTEKRDKSDRPVQVWRHLKHSKIDIPKWCDIEKCRNSSIASNSSNGKSSSNSINGSISSNTKKDDNTKLDNNMKKEKGIEANEPFEAIFRGTKTAINEENILNHIRKQGLTPTNDLISYYKDENKVLVILNKLAVNGDIFEDKPDRWRVLE